MDIPTVLLRNLLQLTSSVGLDDDALGRPLVSLVEDLQAAVPSFGGLHLTIVDNSHPVSLAAFLPVHDGDSITTSLRVRFAALGPGFDGESKVVFYAATPRRVRRPGRRLRVRPRHTNHHSQYSG